MKRLVLILSLFFSAASAQFPSYPLSIVFVADHYGRLYADADGRGGLGQISTIVRQTRADSGNRTLVLSGGNLPVGTLSATAFRGQADVDAMNLIGFDAMALGHHELDYGLEHFASLRERAQFPVLATNLIGLEPFGVQGMILREIGGMRVAILGFVTPDFYSVTGTEAQAFTLLDAFESARTMTMAIRESVDLIIAITHQSTEADLLLLRNVANIDLVLGSGEGNFVGMYTSNSLYDPSLPPGEGAFDLPNRILVKPQGGTAEVARLDLVVLNSRIVEARSATIPVEGFVHDPPILFLLADYEVQLETSLRQVLGYTDLILDGELNSVMRRETNLGNFIADSLLDTFRTANAALVPSSTIFGSIVPGNITVNSLLEIRPADESVIMLDLTGAEILALLELAILDPFDSRFLQVSGLYFTYRGIALPGERIEEVWLAGAPLEPERPYRIVTTESILPQLEEAGIVTPVFDTRLLDIDILAAYVRRLGIVAPAAEARIVNLSEAEEAAQAATARAVQQVNAQREARNAQEAAARQAAVQEAAAQEAAAQRAAAGAAGVLGEGNDEVAAGFTDDFEGIEDISYTGEEITIPSTRPLNPTFEFRPVGSGAIPIGTP